MKIIEDDGWRCIRTRGSHGHYKHPIKRGVVTIVGPPYGSRRSRANRKLHFEAGWVEEMKDYVVILEPAGDGTWGAYVPDLSGCTSGGKTRDEALSNVREAIEGHIEMLREAKELVPEPVSAAEIVHVV